MKKPNYNLPRPDKGFALVSIIVLGVFAIAMMLALFPLVLNVIRLESTGRSMNELRTAAEVGIDYGIAQLNDFALTPPCPIDLTPSTVVPASYLEDFANGTVRIRIRKLSSNEWKLLHDYSTIYSPSLDVENGPNGKNAGIYYSQPIKTSITEDYWRILESTATRGSFSRSIRVFLEPRFDDPPGQPPSNPGTPSSYFKNAFFGNSQVNLIPKTGTLAISSPQTAPERQLSGKYDLAIQSNETASLSSNVTVGADLKVSNSAQGAPVEVVTLADGTAPTINGRLVTNGGVPAPPFDGAQDTANPIYSTINVLANADVINPLNDPRLGLNKSFPVDSNNASGSGLLTQTAQAPAQNNSNAASLPDLSSGADLSGPYSTTSLVLSDGNGSATISAAPVQIYIQDGSTTRDAVNVSASALKNTSGLAENLQIWYSGNRPITINMDSSFTGVIYAPNAPVLLTGGGPLYSFNGALVGDSVTLKNSGSVKINTNFQSDAGGQSAGLAFRSFDGKTPLLRGYKPVTWQELPGTLVP